MSSDEAEYKFDCGSRGCSQTWSGSDRVAIAKRVARHFNEEHGDDFNRRPFKTIQRGGDHIHENIYQVERIDLYVTSFDVMDRMGQEDGLCVLSENEDVCIECHEVIDDKRKATDLSDRDFGDPEWICEACKLEREVQRKKKQNEQLDRFVNGGAKCD